MTATAAPTQAPVERQARPPTIDPWHARRDVVAMEPASDPETATVVEHELRRFPLSVVTRWAAALALTTVIAWWAAIVVLWLVASTLGLTADIESLAREVGFEGFRLASGPVFLALALLGAAWFVAVALVTLFAAAVYNLYAALLGGIRVEAVERPVRDAAPSESTEAPASSKPVALLVD